MCPLLTMPSIGSAARNVEKSARSFGTSTSWLMSDQLLGSHISSYLEFNSTQFISNAESPMGAWSILQIMVHLYDVVDVLILKRAWQVKDIT